MLKGSLKLGSLLGVPVYLHWTFGLLIVWLVTMPFVAGAPDPMGAGLRTAGFVLAVFGCIVLHEMGHALAARRYGVRTRDITLLPIGGVASLERMPEKPGQELVVALAGPAVNVVLAALIVPAVLATDGIEAFRVGVDAAGNATASSLHSTHFLAALGSVNVMLVVFNLIPALPMDGGRVLRAVLAMATDRSRATAIAAMVGQLVAVGFVVFGLFSGHVFLMLIGVFVFLGAGAEAQQERFRAALEGQRVADAMVTKFTVLRASDSLRVAAEELLSGSQQDFPVLSDEAADERDAGALVGVLTRTDLVRGAAAGKMDARVSEVMRRGCPTVDERLDLREALEASKAAGGESPAGQGSPILAVVRVDPTVPSHRRIVGLVTPENVTELVMLREAVHASRG
ncbi:MAG: site-2 protease family protein [Phycisphaeraceae bacterium]|nr:site-2 protease family protein [Phycisphaeraceae bacterium]